MMVQAKPGDPELSSRDALRRMVNMVYAPYKKIHYILYPDFREFIRCLGFVINEGNFFMNRGDLVRMNSGEVAIIEEMNRLYPMNPKVRVVKNSKMETLKRPILIDMLKDHNTYIANVFDRSNK
jgi:virulence-associated protein VapD